MAMLTAIVTAAAPAAFGAGVTIITHGYNPSIAGAPAWPVSMRDDISSNFVKGEQLYGTITVTGSTNALVATCSPWNYSLTNSTNSEALIVVDWSAVADHLTKYVTAQSVAAAVAAKIVAGQNGQRALAELPIHLVGHSRGGGMVCELARQLGEQGIVVDHLTPLDPHPLTTSDTQPLNPPFGPGPIIDTPAAVYQNVVFADGYYQTAASPVGQYVTGAYNRPWGTPLTGGYHNNGSPTNVYADHRNVLLMYQATVNPANPFSNGEAAMGSTERTAWFNAYEAAGANTGLAYSRISGLGNRTSTNTPVAGGDAIRAGLNSHAAFGGGGTRSNLAWSAAVWPNIAQLDVLTNGTALGSGSYAISIGSTQQLRYVYLDYDSGCTVTLRLDADRNPYNTNDVAALSTQVFASATAGNYTTNTVNWRTAGLSAQAAVYVYAQVTDGTRTRYFYAPSRLALVAEAIAPVIDITNASATVSALTTNMTLGGTNNEGVVGTMAWTNAATGAGGTLAATSPWSIADIGLAFGANAITVSGTNAAGTAASDSVTITRDRNAGPGSPIHYVWTNSPAAAWPYTNWTTAAHTIQEAVETADTNDTVLATNGVYDAGGAVRPGRMSTNRVLILRPMTVQSVHGAGSTFIVGAADAAATNGPGAVRCLFMATNAVVSGFTLTNGHTTTAGDAYQDRSGGGAFFDGESVLDGCTLNGNSASYHGGGVFLLNGGTLTNCTLDRNVADSYGGGVFAFSGGTLAGCLVSNNAAYDGGGVFLNNGGTLEHCTLRGNTAAAFGGGAFCIGSATANNCLMRGNTAHYGGGAHLEGGGHLNQCTVSGNTATGVGKGVECNWGGSLTNCIVVGNVPGDTGNLEGGYTAAYCCSPGLSGSGNLTNNPQFANAAAGDYRLAAGSPCIDAGNNAAMPAGADLDGMPRPLDGDANGTAIVDMGCYETLNRTADSSGDGIPDGWAMDHGLNPTANSATNNPDGDAFNTLQEYIADTDPTNPASYFRITAVSNLPPWTVYFVSSTGRMYTLNGCSNLVTGAWTNVPGAGPKTGAGGTDAMPDTNVPAKGPFYRMKVELP